MNKDLRKKLPCSVDILGTTYRAEMRAYKDDPTFERDSYRAYCWGIMRLIVIGDMYTFPDAICKGTEAVDKQAARKNERESLRHEVIHAYLDESGMKSSSLQYGAGWAKNEEMVDWIAIQSPKIIKTFAQLGILE